MTNLNGEEIVGTFNEKKLLKEIKIKSRIESK